VRKYTMLKACGLDSGRCGGPTARLKIVHFIPHYTYGHQREECFSFNWLLWFSTFQASLTTITNVFSKGY
jgi:hypothetical protein